MGNMSFSTWSEVMAAARNGEPLHYRAPLDPHPLRLTKGTGPYHYEARTRTIRIWPPGSAGRGKFRTADPFTADAGHLERFSRG